MKEKLPLIVGIGLPIFLIIFVAVSVYLPSLFVKPKYNFIYATGSLYDYDINVIDGRLSVNSKYYPDTTYRRIPSQPTLFLYDVVNDKSKQITLTQAQSYILDPSDKSPDGFTVGRSESGDSSFFPFFYGRNDRGRYLMGKGLNRKVTDQNYDFKFIGWITNE